MRSLHFHPHIHFHLHHTTSCPLFMAHLQCSAQGPLAVLPRPIRASLTSGPRSMRSPDRILPFLFSACCSLTAPCTFSLAPSHIALSLLSCHTLPCPCSPFTHCPVHTLCSPFTYLISIYARATFIQSPLASPVHLLLPGSCPSQRPTHNTAHEKDARHCHGACQFSTHLCTYTNATLTCPGATITSALPSRLHRSSRCLCVPDARIPPFMQTPRPPSSALPSCRRRSSRCLCS